ncbi:hypothetical protein CFBP6411_05476 [Pseudomonas syringae group genomosp. 3]|uniref:PRTase-CE domain-containing protein n=1 Tax=Pseudomonas syringae group genomosp. 3 TaxID=251701 RepID=A0A2K4WLQ0_9PSED|nr:hypothetical protein [Pseudomonas syringae group genomosp. 3]SOS36833.1 hypothetical protein CFBP6411_05476 [Pseudomonas syringae group genomosp. 3]
MSERQVLIAQLLAIIVDYKQDRIDEPDEAHVKRWLAQFDGDVQLDVLRETVHVLEQTYFSKDKVEEIFSGLIYDDDFGDDAAEFWSEACLLDIQQGGNSQRDLVQMFSRLVAEEFGEEVSVNSCDASNYFYLDDAVFSGNRLLADVAAWINDSAPRSAELYIVVIAMHSYGNFNVGKRLDKVIAESGKNIRYHWRFVIEFEDRLRYNSDSDVLRPKNAPDNQDVTNYISEMSRAPEYRVGNNRGGHAIFSSAAGRNLIEQQFLIAGAKIRRICPNLPTRHRPLGYNSLEMLGFGSMFVTYRNCPNNAPLALWVGDPWYPLFPRSTNADAAVNRLLHW